MPAIEDFDANDWLSRLDISSIPDFNDKVQECEFFFGLLSVETDRSKFRWLLSGFLNAAYSFFESTALTAHFRFTDADGEPYADHLGLEILRRHVKVEQRKNDPNYVKTAGLTPATKKLYDIRKRSTHRFPLCIMAVGESLPEDFQIGDMKGEGVPIMPLCRDITKLIQDIYTEIND